MSEPATLRYGLLAAAKAPELEQLADVVLATGVDIRVVSGPEVGVLPLQIAEATGGDYAVGRLVVTVCSVQVAGYEGHGVYPGRNLRAALAAAICDAEVARGGPEADAVASLLCRAERGQREGLEAEARGVEATRLEPTSGSGEWVGVQ